MSGLRCRVGDLAVVVESMAGNEGKIVTCIRFDPRHRVLTVRGVLTGAWVIDRQIPAFDDAGNSGVCAYAADSQLCPIRDNDGEDEMLRLAGRPTKTVFEFIADVSAPRRQVEHTR